MYERTYGYRYKAIEGGTKEIAAQMRRDIRALVDAGMLPGEPVTYSVTMESFAGGSAINIEVRGFAGNEWEPQEWTCRECRTISPGEGDQWPTACPTCPAHNFDLFGQRKRTPAAAALHQALEEIHNAYNHDGSESMTDYFDVRYYGSVSFQSAWAVQYRAERQAKAATLKNAPIVGRAKVYKRDGSHVVHLLADVDGKQRLACGATTWRGSLISKTEAEPTCSRCARKAARVHTTEGSKS